MVEKFIYAVLLLILTYSCKNRNNELMFYIKSRDIENDRRVKVYLENELIIDMDLARNNIEENYNKFLYYPRKDQASLIRVVLNDSLAEEKRISTEGSHRIFIIIDSSEKRRDYSNVEIYKHLEGSGTNNLNEFADSLYDNGIIEERYIQVPKDSVIDIGFRKIEASH